MLYPSKEASAKESALLCQTSNETPKPCAPLSHRASGDANILRVLEAVMATVKQERKAEAKQSALLFSNNGGSALCRTAMTRLAHPPTTNPCAPLSHRAPGDADILRELAAVKATVKQERKAEASLFRGAFGPRPPPLVDPLLPREGYAGDGPEASGGSGAAGGMRQRGGSGALPGGMGRAQGGAGEVEGQSRRGWFGWLMRRPK